MYTTNTKRYMSNAGGMGELFFLVYTAIFKPTILFEPVFQPASSEHSDGTEETPLV
jgi:hypothetical protein